jgi:hypothetical protein
MNGGYNMIETRVIGGTISEEEKNAYIQRGIEKYKTDLESIDIEVDGEFVNLHYHIKPVPFQRIRRITGYLVGTLDRFNDAKREEVENRVKHFTNK